MANRIIFSSLDLLFVSENEELKQFIAKYFGDVSTFRACFDKYKKTYATLDQERFKNYFSYTLGIPLKDTTIHDLITLTKERHEFEKEEAKQTLSYLTERGYELALLPDWFREVERDRLANSCFASSFDVVLEEEETSVGLNFISSRLIRRRLSPIMRVDSYGKYQEKYHPARDCVLLTSSIGDYQQAEGYGFTPILYAPEADRLVGGHKIKTLTTLKHLY